MIYYSHVNEDNWVERQMMAQRPFNDLCCIVGSGERVISLMDQEGLQNVYAVDNNPEALFLLELKLMALKNLSVEAYLAFIGLDNTKDKNRLGVFNSFKITLSIECRHYWEKHLKTIGRGILHCGHFERFLGRIRPLLGFTLGNGFYDCFKKPLSECDRFPHRRWQWLRTLFTQRWVYIFMGNRDTAFIAGDASRKCIPDALQQTLQQGKVNGSFMFHLIFKGILDAMPPGQWPPSLQPQILKRIKSRLESDQLNIHYKCGDLLSLWQRLSLELDSCFFSLSDLLSFVNFDYIKSFFLLANQSQESRHCFVLRSFLRNDLKEEEWQWLDNYFTNISDLSDSERTGMYKIYAFDHA